MLAPISLPIVSISMAESDVDPIQLVPLEHNAPYSFRCSREEQTEFLLQHALPDQQDDISRTYLAYRGGILVGYFTLAMDAIGLMQWEKPRPDIRYGRLPAIKLAQLGVEENLEGQGIGKELVANAAALALNLRSQVGCRYLTVDAATKRLVGWYTKQQFVINKVDQKAKKLRAQELGIDPAALPTSMRLDLHHFLIDLADHYPHDFQQP